ncbi:hypothetical protein [Sphingomonas jeddahensis]|uniref:Secreted protein n=1 Tax=Sphingomonas jeddahensis TaxID=1915074 RepID=A0A1V2EV09_9SPHN|nr:hypothetical protein [Sphingomonas jeddahensis]ONF96430.1 hypothetical protein SPHI_12150 [Sphingomonas jeddahensis]
MNIVAHTLFAALLVTPVAASAQTVSHPKEDKSDPNRMVCRTVETTGSRLGKRKICRTAAEWTEVQAMERRDLDRNQALRTKNN